MRPAAVQITSGEGGGGGREGVESELDGGEPKSAVCRLTQHFFYSAVLPKSGSGRLGRRGGWGGWVGNDQRGRDRQTGRPWGVGGD